MKNFDLNGTLIRKGTSLIEASAGTGKTYTIAGIFLRLILESNLPVREILVVTYTVAATEELRGRIRDLISEASKAFISGESKNPFLQALYLRHEDQKEEMQARLEQALYGFDEAPIYSIHGFCQKILKDRAFESGALFDMELVTDISSLLQQMADDYWRNYFYRVHSVAANFALKNGFRPERLLPLLQACLNYPFIKLLSPVEGESVESLAMALENAFEKAKEIWAFEKESIKLLFGSAQKKNWANAPYNDDEKVKDFFRQLDDCFSSSPTLADFGVLQQFCSQRILAGTGKNKQPPQHRFFNACDEIVRGEENFLIGLQIDFYHFALRELPTRKNRQKIQSFDDLLTRLHAALHGPAGHALAVEIRAKYPAALIDEFQDTDPIQYQIFDRIFAGGENFLFLIGDPKQAIYGFRGADIFTYMQAAAKVDEKFSLDENWRSETGLVQAVNTIFGNTQRPFVFEKIQFQPVKARGAVNQTPLTSNGQPEPPFELWFWPRTGKHITKETAENELPKIVAAEISRLLNSDTRIGDRKLKPEDIAVLVLEHRQAQRMQEALNALNIPSVQQTNANLFDSEEAEELQRILLAVSQPGNERLLKAALATTILGLSGNDIGGISGHGGDWQSWLEWFHEYLDTWTHQGFIQMFRLFLQRRKIRSHLLSLPEGERRLTNLLHLGEVLHQVSVEQRLGMNGLLKWLANQRHASGGTAEEEYQLRLERDENAVKLVTVHKSKGLQYGIVFCPFSWKHSDISRGGEEQIAFHERAGGQFIRDLGSPHADAHRKLAVEERLAENLRLLYVALTRAQHRCYFVWGHFLKSESSAPAWLFHQAIEPQENGLEAAQARFKGLTDEGMMADLKSLEEASAGTQANATIRVSPLPNQPGARYTPAETALLQLEHRRLDREISHDWRITSFSWLTKQQSEELPDRDEPEEAVTEEASGIFAFPKGSRPGTCLHEIFEELDFAETNGDVLTNVVSEKLRRHGFAEAEFSPVVCHAVRQVLTVPLEPKSSGLTLAQIKKQERLTELEFYFPLQKLSAQGLAKIFSQYGDIEVQGDTPTQLDKLTFDPVLGYMKGFIDLVFRFEGKYYIVDWKSNWLGDKIENYNAKAIRAAMAEKHYLLQYHLYALALHKYLSIRLPNYRYAEHFGGVFYIFLRGVEAAQPEYGVFRDCPAEKLIMALERQLIRPAQGGGQ